jgi:hypothetical protein
MLKNVFPPTSHKHLPFLFFGWKKPLTCDCPALTL